MDKPSISDQQTKDEKQNTEDRLSMEAVHAMCQFAQDQLKNIDKNKDGYLTKLELDDAADSGKYKGEELRQLKVLAEHAGDLQKLINHTGLWLDDNKGVAWRDLREAQKIAADKTSKLEDLRAFRDTFNRNFAKLDTNDDNRISFSELRAASKSYEFNRTDRMNLADALRKWYQLGNPSTPSAIPRTFFDTRVKEEEDRNSSDWRSKLIWSMGDKLKK